MESKYPKWQSVYYYYRIWKKQGTLGVIMRELVKLERIRQGREAQASVSAIDSQSVKVVAFVNEETGIDGGKKVNGRKRHLLVDVNGLPLAIHVYSAWTNFYRRLSRDYEKLVESSVAFIQLMFINIILARLQSN